MKKSLVFACTMALGALVPARADEGRIPLGQPVFSNQTVTITAPGSYVLTSNLFLGNASTNPSAIAIQASNVTLDLNGFTVEIFAGTGSAILIFPDQRNIHIRNGKIRGGLYGIEYSMGAVKTTVRLEKLEISSTLSDGLNLSGVESFEMLECKIRDTGNNGLAVLGSAGFTGRIVGNQFTGIPNNALVTSGASSLLIRENAMREVNSGINIGLGGSSIQIEDNSVMNRPGGQAGATAISLFSSGQVLHNAIRGFATGIATGATGGRIAGNSVTGGVGTGDGVLVSASRNLIEGNQIEGNAGCGIHLLSSSAENAYRDNMLRGNTGGAACVAGTGNTDAGGNVL